MQFYGDYHTHTRYSDGRQNQQEIVEAACSRGLQEVAITDHGPLAAVIGVKNDQEYLKIKEEIETLNLENNHIRVLAGAEANIRDLKGTLDIAEEIVEELDILIAGLHPYTLPTGLEDGWDIFVQNSLRHLGKGQQQKAIINNTKATVEAIYNNPRLDILSHPGLFFQVDTEEVARACVKKQVIFEINCGHEHPPVSDIMKADKSGVDFIINSDAHFPDSVGQLEYGSWVVEQVGIDPERVVNSEIGGGHSAWGKRLKAYTYS